MNTQIASHTTSHHKQIILRTRMMLLLVATVLTLLVSAFTASAQDCASQGGIVVHPGQGVMFSQVTYSFAEILANVGLEPSATGEIDVDVSQIEALMSSGFINVVTDAGWVTQNLPILPGYYDQRGYGGISSTLNLNVAPGTTVVSLNATVCYSSQPIAQISSQAFDTFAVSSAQYNAEGMGGGADSIPPPPPIGAIGFQQNGPNQFYVQGMHSAPATDVQTATNQCAPASVANSFEWLNLRWNTQIPDQNIPGLRDTVRNSRVGKLDMVMTSLKDIASCTFDVAGRWANLNDGFGGRY